MYKKFSAGVIMAVIMVIPAVASAHVVVTPAQVGVAAFETFATGVPNEKDQPVTGLRLVIPAGLHYVSPNVKPGWDVQTVKSGDNVTEIDWTGGSIPAGQRDDFDFAAQTPANPTQLHWKAYETYADGTVVAWDQTPNGKDSEDATPYSTTKVVNDLAATNAAATGANSNAPGILGLIFGAAALIVSVGSAVIRKHR